VAVRDSMSVRRRDRMTVRRTDSVHLVPTGIVALVSASMMRATMTASKAEERHGSHACGSENDAENIEVHLYWMLRESHLLRNLRVN
jgi:hypothetical protein